MLSPLIDLTTDGVTDGLMRGQSSQRTRSSGPIWLPKLEGVDWDAKEEEHRRTRAKTVVGHALDNSKFKKSESSWEVDAWSDVFSQMRDDPIIAADKREYRETRIHRIKGKPTFIRCVPDATFGLSTFSENRKLDYKCYNNDRYPFIEVSDYDKDFATRELDKTRLEALAIHRKCGLLADPSWGEADLVFPFAVYEAKSSNATCGQADFQVEKATLVYLRMLDHLARKPGAKALHEENLYQTLDSGSFQTFTLTSIGPEWSVMVGYRRALRPQDSNVPNWLRTGRGNDVYRIDAIWNGKVTNERKAWELLSIVDQIHHWAITKHRDFVIRHVREWHEFCEECHRQDAIKLWLSSGPYKKRHTAAASRARRQGLRGLRLADWTEYLGSEAHNKIRRRAIEIAQDLQRV
ncbi:hypothetical protein MCOR25_005358 [Pyricularia grisea]|nr:hypothetical protein MCOR25_005358 [Pyricularia grisea]